MFSKSGHLAHSKNPRKLRKDWRHTELAGCALQVPSRHRGCLLETGLESMWQKRDKPKVKEPLAASVKYHKQASH